MLEGVAPNHHPSPGHRDSKDERWGDVRPGCRPSPRDVRRRDRCEDGASRGPIFVFIMLKDFFFDRSRFATIKTKLKRKEGKERKKHRSRFAAIKTKII